MTNLLNKSGHILKRPKVCKPSPPPPPTPGGPFKAVELGLSPSEVFENGDVQCVLTVKDSSVPIGAGIECFVSAATGTTPDFEHVPNFVTQHFIWGNLTGPAGQECLQVHVTWPDHTTTDTSGCVDYKS